MKKSTWLKSLVALFFMGAMITTVSAQKALEYSKPLDNTFVSVGATAATPLSDMFSDMFPVNGIANVAAGKWFSPYFGVQLAADVWFGSHAHNRDFGAHGPYGGHNVVRGLQADVEGLFNWSNIFAPYPGKPRFFEVGSIVGFGWVHGLSPHTADGYNNSLGAKTGMDFSFNLGEEKKHTISVRPGVVWNLSTPGGSCGSSAFNRNGAQLYLGAAYTYHFRTSNGTSYFKTYDVGAMNNTIDSLRTELEKKPKEVIKEVVKTVEVPAKSAGISDELYIFFAKSSAELTPDAKAILDKIDGGVVEITASSSPEGTAAFNQNLSDERAKAVAEYLKAKGITVNSATGTGVKNDTSGRVAIVKVIK